MLPLKALKVSDLTSECYMNIDGFWEEISKLNFLWKIFWSDVAGSEHPVRTRWLAAPLPL